MIYFVSCFVMQFSTKYASFHWIDSDQDFMSMGQCTKIRNFASFLYWPIDMWCCVPSSRFDEFYFLLCIIKAYSRLVLSQWQTSLQSNVVSHWLGSNLESTLIMLQGLIATAEFLVELMLYMLLLVIFTHVSNGNSLQTGWCFTYQAISKRNVVFTHPG